MTAVAGSQQESAALGRALRREVPRGGIGQWLPASDRPDPVGVLCDQAATRVPELVPVRYQRMLVSPFTFYRGAAAIMAADLAAAPHTNLRVQLCGDAHLSNFGGFASPERSLVFSVNDFDETLPGPWEWDLARLAASVEIAGRDRGDKRSARQAAVAATVRTYRTAMREFAAMRHLDLWYVRLDADTIRKQLVSDGGRGAARRFDRTTAKAHAKDSLRAFDKLTEHDGERLRIVSEPPLITPIEEMIDADPASIEGWVAGIMAGYARSLRADRRALLARHRYVHLARKVVGVGSVGTRAWIVLLAGRDDGDPLFLQVKEAQPSVLEPYAGRARQRNHGQRVVEGQWLMQAASDIFLGWLRAEGIDGETRDFYVRQLWDWKVSAEVETLAAETFPRYGEICGWTLARAHARTGDAAAIAGYLGSGDKYDRAMVTFAEVYADQNEHDYAALQDAVRVGRVVAAPHPEATTVSAK